MKNAKKAITKPMIAAIIVPRALSTFALSPPDVIHRIPPKIRKKRAIRTATIKMKVTAAPIIAPRLSPLRPQSVSNPLWIPSHGSTLVPANAYPAVARYAALPETIAVRTFFILSLFIIEQ